MENNMLLKKVLVKLPFNFNSNSVQIQKIWKIKTFLKLQLIFFFCLLLVVKLPFRLNILLCTIAKEENKYIQEFVNHYKNMKFKQIIIYDNNDIKGENIKDILKSEIKNNFVKIVNYRGIERPQKKVFDDCYNRFNQKYDWIAFYDIDEYLHIINFTDINEFLSLQRFKKCQSILINWKNYGDNDKLYYEPKQLHERFTKPFYFNEKHKKYKYLYSAAKTIVRGGLNIKWEFLPHYLNNTINCRADGNILSDYFTPPEYSDAYLIHYATKSTEEFAEKCNRGNANSIMDEKFIKERIFVYYFIFNRKTKQKLDIFEKKLKIKIKF